MWHTSTGDRTLSGAEATLIAETCTYVVDALEWEMRNPQPSVMCETGVPLFDQQLVHQRIALLDEVSRALLKSEHEMLELTAERESTVMAIFETVKSNIGMEIDAQQCCDSTSCDYRSLVLAAWGFNPPDTPFTNDDLDEMEPYDVPDPWCDDFQQWDLLIELLADRILWDRDFEMASLIVDEEPALADTYKQILGIQRDYFSKAPPEVEECQALPSLQELRRFLSYWTPPGNS